MVMGPLQTALLAIGALIILMLVLHNAWLAWQRRRRRARVDAIEAVAELRLEPGLDLGAEPGLERTDADAAAAAPRARPQEPRIDPLIDAIASFMFEQAVPGESLLERLPRSARAGNKPMLFEGCNADSGAWEPLQPQQRYLELQAAVQIANRGGALNAIEFSEFVTKCHALGEALAVVPDLPDMRDVLEHARELDDFAAGHDAQLSITLQAQNVAWDVEFLRQQAQQAGLDAVLSPGRLALQLADPDDALRLCTVLQLQFDPQAELTDHGEAPVTRATLLLDVPQVPQPLQPFQQLRDAAQRLAQGLEARLVDDNGRDLSQTALAAIAQQLEQLYRDLDLRGLAAGSPVTQRLFS